MLLIFWNIDFANIQIYFIKPEVETAELKNTDGKYSNDAISLINILC